METKSFFIDRLKSARLLNGFSLHDLATAMDNKVSRQALHRWEKGEVIPDQEKIGFLSKALNVSPQYFFRSTKIELGEIEFRKLSKMSHKDTFIIIEKTKEYLSRYLELEESIGIRNNFINPLEDFTNITTYDQVVQAADMLRQKWSLGKGPIYNIVELLEDKNIKVLKLNVDEDFDGLQTFVNGDIPVIAFNILKANKPDRIRFTLLHELAHLLLKFGNIIDREKENFCHKFAGAMLMPKETIIAELGQFRNKLSINELGKIKLQYGISMQALVMRAKDCGIINEHYTKQFFFLMKQMNWRIDEPFEYAGLEQSNRFEQLIFRGLIEDQIPIEKAAELSDLSVQQFKKLHNIF